MHIRRSTFVTGLLGSVSLISMLASAHTALANPEGASVEAGSATIGQADVNTLLIQQQTQRAIINWESFNVGNGETTRFVLPDAQSVTLNRDLSGSLSEVYGSIESNGRFFLVNPNGILFGPDSRIDVAGLVATTHDIRSQDFMAGRYEFSIPGNPDARVINQGYVSVQDLGFGAFVAPHVRNEGAVVARMGRVELASANGFTLDLHGDRLISFLVENPNEHQIYDANGDPIYALVENSGELIADGGVVAMSASAARGVIDGVINTDGIVQANTVEQRGGRIILGGGNAGIVRTSGQITARGEGAGDTGGEVEVTGELLWADEFARFDISGMFGGGRLMFGGDYLGGSVDAETAEANGFTLADRDIQTALAVRMDEGAIINADAIAFGDGGTVILWSDDTTRFGGEIFARGGPSGGDGGAVETSGRLSLDVTGTVDASAPGGLNGIWLLDPTADVYIVGASQNQVIDSSTGGGSFFFEPIATPSFVRAQTIESALNSGTDVTVQTYNFSGEPGPGTIFLQENIRKTSGGGATLTFSANTGFSATNGNFIRSTSGPLNIAIDADSDDREGGFIDVAGNSNYVFQTNGGSIDMRAWDFRIQGRAIVTNGGNVTLRHIDDTATWMTIANSRGNNFVINAGAGDVLLDTNFEQGDDGNRIELGNYAIRGDRITIDAAAVTNIGEGFDWTNDEYTYTTPSFNNADGIGELFYRTIRYRGGAEEGTIDGSIISSTVFRDIERLEAIVQRAFPPSFVGPSCSLWGSCSVADAVPNYTAATGVIGGVAALTYPSNMSIQLPHNFPMFNQRDADNEFLYGSRQWALSSDAVGDDIRVNETCLSAVYAMIEYGRNRSDYRVGERTWVNGVGSSRISGVSNSLPVNLENIRSQLALGNPVILNGSSPRLNANGHWVLAVGITASGRILAIDPFGVSETGSGSTIEIDPNNSFIGNSPAAGDLRIGFMRTVAF